MPGTKRKGEGTPDADLETTKKKRSARQPSEKLHMTTRRAKSILESLSSATPSTPSSNYDESRRSSIQSGFSGSTDERKDSGEEIDDPLISEILASLGEEQPSGGKIEESIEPESLGPPKKKFAVPAIQVEAPSTTSKKLSERSTTAHNDLLEVPPPLRSPAKARRGRPPTIRQSPAIGKRPPGRQRVPKKNPRMEADYLRMSELKSIFGKVGKALAPTLEELASRSLNKMGSEHKAHKEVPEFTTTMQALEKSKQEQIAMLDREFQLQKEHADRVCRTELQEIHHKFQIQCREIQEDIKTHIDVGMMSLLTDVETDVDATDDEVDVLWRPAPTRYNVRNRGHFKGTYHFSERYRMPNREGRFYKEADTVFEDLMDRVDMAEAINLVDPSQQLLKSKDTRTAPILPRPYDQVQKESQLDHAGIEMILGAHIYLEDRQYARLADLASMAQARADERDAAAAADRKKLLKKTGRKAVKRRKGSSPLPPSSEEPHTDRSAHAPTRRRLAPKPLPLPHPLPLYNREYNSPMYPDYQPSRGAHQMGTTYAQMAPGDSAGADSQVAGGAEYQYMRIGYANQPSYYHRNPGLPTAGAQAQKGQYSRPDTPMGTTFVHYDGPSPSQTPPNYRQIAPAPGAMLPPPPPRPVSWDHWLAPANGAAFPPHISSHWS